MGGGGMTSTSNTNQTTQVKIPREIRKRGSRITKGAMAAYYDPARQYTPYSYTNIVGQNYGLGSMGGSSGTSTSYTYDDLFGGNDDTGSSGGSWGSGGYTGGSGTSGGSWYGGSAPLPTSLGYQPGSNPSYVSPFVANGGVSPPTALGYPGSGFGTSPEIEAVANERRQLRDELYRLQLQRNDSRGTYDPATGTWTGGEASGEGGTIRDPVTGEMISADPTTTRIDQIKQRMRILSQRAETLAFRTPPPPAEVGPNGLPITYADVGRDTTAQLNAYHDQTAGYFGEAGQNWRPYLDQATGVASEGYANTPDAQIVNDPNYNWSTVSQFMNPFLQGVLDWGYQDIAEQQNQQRLQDQSRAAGAGAFGGARHGVVDALNTQTYADNLRRFTDEQLNTGFNQAVGQYNTDFSQKLAAAQANNAANEQDWQRAASLSQIYSNLGKQVQDQTLASGTANMSLAEVIRQQEQAQKDNAYNKGYLDNRDYPMQVYERLAAINAMQPHNTTTQTQGTTTTETSGSAGAGGIAGSALSAIGSLFSDVRAKENIEDVSPEKVLGAFAKVTPKTYDYKDEVRAKHPDLAGEGRRIGFMAQDLEKAFKRPSGPEIDGLKTVDTGNLLGSIVAAIHGLEKRTRKLRGRG